MKITYDPEADAMNIVFEEGSYEVSEELTEGVIVDFSAEGKITAIEILDVSRRLPDASMEEVRRLPLPA